jgi:hypothetical protein
VLSLDMARRWAASAIRSAIRIQQPADDRIAIDAPRAADRAESELERAGCAADRDARLAGGSSAG